MTEVLSTPVEQTSEPAAPALPDFLLSPNAVFNDQGVKWRYGRAPDYSKTRKVWEEGEHAVTRSTADTAVADFPRQKDEP